MVKPLPSKQVSSVRFRLAAPSVAVLRSARAGKHAHLRRAGFQTFCPAPADPLGNLRLLAGKKNVSFAEELALYFSELAMELEQLNTALQTENAIGAGHYAHLLCGRCGFIYERELEQTLRKIETLVANQQWADARLLGRDLQAQLAGLRVRLASAAPVAPRV